ncbi:MAG: Ig-like domain-containing protein, partial [Desulfuromonadaceae bacterium]|nr:Ig-like domain-containing protein [Desulfuromonadaceae bacterium]
RLVGGQLQKPCSVAVDDQTGYIYVVDTKANQIEMYTASGVFVKAFAKGVKADANGTTVSNPVGMLSGPTGISFERVSRRLVVADTLSHRVQFFDVDGNFVKSIGIPLPGTNTTYSSLPVQMMQFVLPTAIAFQYSKTSTPVLERIYISDAYLSIVHVIDAATDTPLLVAGTSKNYLGTPGTANGQLMSPVDLAFDADNSRLFVVDGSLSRVGVYGIDGGTTPVYVDRTPPSLSVNPVIATISTPTVMVTGSVEVGAVVAVSADSGSLVSPVEYVSASEWKAQITALSPGLNTISVVAKDAAGNSSQPITLTTSYITPAPALAVDAEIPGQTNNSALVLTGTVDQGASVSVTNGSTAISGFAAVTGTEWSYTVALAEGLNNISVVAQKEYSEKASLTVSSVLDSVAPVLNVSAIADGSSTGTQVQNISGNVVDANLVSVLVNGLSVALLDNSFTTPVSLVSGANTITVSAVDLAGNAVLNTRTVNFDATAPVIAVTAPMDNSVTNIPQVQIAGTVDENSVVTVSGIQASINNNIWTADLTLQPGLNTIEVVATDLFGNSSTLKRSIVYDAAKALLAISSPVQDIAVNKEIKIYGTVDDSDAKVATYSINGIESTTKIRNGKFSFKAEFEKDGVYPIIVSVENPSGAVSTATRTLIYDTVSPKLTVDGLSRRGLLTGTVEQDATVEIKDNGRSLRKANVVVNGTAWSVDLSRVEYNKNRLSIVATDAAGNSTTRTLRDENHRD